MSKRNLSDSLDTSHILVNLRSKNREDVIEELVKILVKAKDIHPSHKKDVVHDLLMREAVMSTGLGQGVAIPHTRSEHVDRVKIVFGKSPKGVNFGAIDGEPIYLFFLVIVPGDAIFSEIGLLARVSRLLKYNYVRELLKKSKHSTKSLGYNFLYFATLQ